MTTGEIIKQRREALGIEQKAMAEELGITPSMLCQIERGTKMVTMPLAKRIAYMLECTIDELAG